MNIRVRANLLEKTVIIDGKKQEVYGLADFYTKPTRIGIGRHCLMAFEEIAKKDGKYCVVLFCDDGVTGFYLGTGYYYYGMFEGKHVFTSCYVKNIKLTEKW